MDNSPTDEWAFELAWQETAPGEGEGVLNDYQTGKQYRSASLVELMMLLRRLTDNVPTPQDDEQSDG